MILFVILGSVLFVHTNSFCYSYRVGGHLIKEGTTVYELLEYAGKPDRKTTIKKGVDVGLSNNENANTVKIFYYEDGNSLKIIKVQDYKVIEVDWERLP